MDKDYRYEFDNPYRMLAAGIATKMSVNDAKRIIADRDFIRQLVQAEVRENMDVPGIFTDCIATELISERKKVLYRDALNKLGLFFYEQLDIPRMREELRRFYKEFGIEL